MNPARTSSLHPGIGRLAKAGLAILLTLAVVVPTWGDTSAPQITTVAGTGQVGFSGDGGPATLAHLNLFQVSPSIGGGGIAFDNAGNLFLADTFSNRIRRVDATTGIISTLAGNGSATKSGDGGPSLQAGISAPILLTMDLQGDLYFTELINTGAKIPQYIGDIRKIDPAGTISTLVGGGKQIPAEGVMASQALIGGCSSPVTDRSGNLYFATINENEIFRIDSQGILHVVAGGGTLSGTKADGMPATQAMLQFHNPAGGTGVYLTIDPSGSIYFTEMGSASLRKIDSSGKIHTIAHLPDVSAWTTIDTQGNLYISDSSQVYKVTVNADGTSSMVSIVGSRPSQTTTSLGDGGPAFQGNLDDPGAMALDSAGNLYIEDVWHDRIRKVTGMTAPGLVMNAPFPLLLLPGDVNGDGQVTPQDAVLALQLSLGSTAPTAAQLQAGDLNGDGKITTADVLKILQIAIGLGSLSQAPPAAPDPRIYPPDSSPFGQSYADWIAEDARRIWQTPQATNAYDGPNSPDPQAACQVDQSEPLWFFDVLPSPDIPNVWALPCSIPAGKAIFFAFGDSAQVNSPDPTNPNNLSDSDLLSTVHQVDQVVPIEPYRQTYLDGVPIDIDAYRLASGVFTVQFPQGAIFGYPAGTAHGAAEGDYIILQPLSVGEHMIEDHVVINGVPSIHYTVLTIAPSASQ